MERKEATITITKEELRKAQIGALTLLIMESPEVILIHEPLITAAALTEKILFDETVEVK